MEAMARKKKDVALVLPPAEEGAGYRMIRRRAASGAVEAGVLVPLRHGRNISGEVVRLEPRKDSPFLFNVETDPELSTAQPPTDSASRGGPPQIATDDYRRGWDAIWGSRPKAKPAALN
jgi:hypothetical protein